MTEVVSPSQGFQATVQMPHKTPIHQPVVGKWKLRKDWAKGSAALEVVRQLYGCGELDVHLKVIKREKVDNDDEDEDDDGSGDKAGTKGRRQFYGVKSPPGFNLNESGPFYLYCISMNLVTPMTNPRYKVHYPQEDTRSLGFLCSSQLPSVTNLDIFSLSGLVKTDIQLVRQVEMTARELQLVERFHQNLFTTVLQSTSLLDYLRQSSPLLVPLLGSDKLDFSICQKVVNHSLATSSVRIDTKVCHMTS